MWYKIAYDTPPEDFYPIKYTNNQLNSPLLRLPGELRNMIYSMAFSRNHSIDLTLASGPSKNPLLICRKTREESRSHYEQAKSDYWSQNTFFLRLHPADSIQKRPEVVAAYDRLGIYILDQIQHIMIEKNQFDHRNAETIVVQYEVVDLRGIWKEVSVLHGVQIAGPRYHLLGVGVQGLYRPWEKKYATLDEAEAAVDPERRTLTMGEQIERVIKIAY